MNSYDPDRPLPPTDWLQTDEGERVELVSSYHRRERVRLPNAQLHSVIHVLVENQLALGEAVVVQTLGRLQADGLGRHDALHAIGSVLAADLYELLREESRSTSEASSRYLEGLQKLKAKDWLVG